MIVKDMTRLTHDNIRHIARLARLRLTQGEVERLSNELTSILTYVDQLKKVDTENIEATAQVTGLRNVFREDRIICGKNTQTGKTLLRPAGRPDPDLLLNCSPLPIVEHQIQTPSAHG